MRLIDDLIELACLRARPLAEYRHPAWQLASWARRIQSRSARIQGMSL
jgi:hypothetical protein